MAGTPSKALIFRSVYCLFRAEKQRTRRIVGSLAIRRTSPAKGRSAARSDDKDKQAMLRDSGRTRISARTVCLLDRIFHTLDTEPRRLPRSNGHKATFPERRFNQQIPPDVRRKNFPATVRWQQNGPRRGNASTVTHLRCKTGGASASLNQTKRQPKIAAINA
jgi:hypothetical protein